MKRKIKVGWEDAILEVLHKKGGVVTLSELYSEVPQIIGYSKSLDHSHTIRAYLRRLKTSKKLIKQIGLSTYALQDIGYRNQFYENVQDEKFRKNFLKDVVKQDLHGYVEGMLVELGNFTGYETYTADKNVTFNGKRLNSIVTYNEVPKFSYSEIIEKVKRIDVIWFKEGFPVKTFDVENSTDFSKALIRAYQLRFYKTSFYLISDESKRKVFNNRANTSPFSVIKNETEFITFQEVYDIYSSTAIHDSALRTSKIFS